MKVLIIEDELLAQDKLENMLHELNPTLHVVARLGSVKDSLVWLSQHAHPDLAFADIQLSDDHSFEIFRKHPIQFPVIFTTAYDKFLLESFEFNSIDYLLKPITADKLKRALEKVGRLEQHFIKNNVSKIMNLVQGPLSKNRIIAKKGTEFIVLNIQDIAYFHTEHKIVFVKDFSGSQFIVNENLTELEAALDSGLFFRINRKILSNIKAIDRFKPDSGRIRIFLKPEMKEEIHVSKEMAPAFREWIGGGKGLGIGH